MLDYQSYLPLLTSICAVLATLLGSVGIFVSLTVQRRIERLQDVLEEFLDLSYNSETNITGKMYKLIEKYQMHYLFPETPGKMILQYINLTITVIMISWLVLASVGFKNSLSGSLAYFAPILPALGILVFYRYLLRNAIFPFGNNLMSPLIPPPSQLRSVSYLSRYVNVSVKSILRQARLRLLIKRKSEETAIVILKEELSFDDYFYYTVISAGENPVFLAFGTLVINFRNEPVTGKPIPAAKNVNIPIGNVPWQKLTGENFEARFLIFPKGEKHPLDYHYILKRQEDMIVMSGDPEISVNYMITYQIEDDKFKIIEANAEIPYFVEMAGLMIINKKRFACCEPFKPENVVACDEPVYIN